MIGLKTYTVVYADENKIITVVPTQHSFPPSKCDYYRAATCGIDDTGGCYAVDVVAFGLLSFRRRGVGPTIPSVTDDGWGVSQDPSVSVIRPRRGPLWRDVLLVPLRENWRFLPQLYNSILQQLFRIS